ncbi:HK97-gp10 family putative phage morphogenesis protein [Evansella cellulosilytica]|uniref:Phage protein, HK97 gp10 family n=1 Tax=Evansella cellulosilytica (strain ATCC 21833 / DSM 2522 / FERM P-1141 / JCM 9156 / N-4) TaxID=649639 RepID=E6TVG4_EVAC2|nr:HK97-gp10 family putative phage morphogenesis protein [Evansella cellulosilytica]ADU30981.1 phage protein, HK97 gp10 family [Evansella cellulosilytica DSM 2522]
MTNISLEGLESLQNALNELGVKGEKISDDAVEKGAEFIERKFEQSVYSFGLNRRTGTAQREITKERIKTGEYIVGTTSDAFYLYFWEMGFYHVGTAKRRKRRAPGRYMAPRPILTPVFERNKSGMINAMAVEARRGLGL